MIDWTGHVKVTVFDGPMEDGVVKEVREFHNLVTTDGKNLLLSALGGTSAKITDMAWGTDNFVVLPLAVTNHTLGTENSRKAVTNSAKSSDLHWVTRCYLNPGEANVHIYELGWFGAGNVLIARVAYDHTKTSAESILIERTDIFA